MGLPVVEKTVVDKTSRQQRESLAKPVSGKQIVGK
jgi:hypothetical protein